MTSEEKPKKEVITCGDCGKTKGNVGKHWICEDCKVNDPQDQ